MAKKRVAWEYMVYYGAAGATAATLINKNVVDADPGGNQDEYVDLPTRGDGTTIARGSGTRVPLGRVLGRSGRRVTCSPAQAFSAEVG